MNLQVSSIVDVILDRSPEELIGGVLMALVLALGLSGLFHLIRRKVSDTSTLIVCLALSSNLVAMTVGGAFVRYKFTGGRSLWGARSVEAPAPPPGIPGGRSGFIASRILESADLNGDRLLSADEAVFAAAQFVKESGEGGDSPLDERRLRAAIWARLGPHSSMGMGRDGPSRPAERPTATGKVGHRSFRNDREQSSH
ncbi:hypothetical protein [Singulisphaera acidiphila]|uniref:EF-hand domain-containing protein n=1 Tax=Singulisphaera acidiphila (strain ATCC BAA-1392 / DSM 18658 / VKM B-2454 / MOB10) TaxID=886293 RepID=L0DFG1_SINAD|nr:hypothetical protein [Singulisphaera acidiphila]AGA27558.1 hypothetical protein Sinac_3288 [Singulisphaera acidiphila DSM 18658]